MEERRGTANTAELNLKTTLSLLDETAEQTADIQGLMRARKTVDDVYDQSFWKGMKAQSEFYKEIGQIEQKLDRAIRLAKEAETANPHVIVQREDVEFDPEMAISYAYFQKGLLNFGQGFWKNAQSWFERSLDMVSHQSTQLFLGYTFAAQGHRQDAMEALQKTIDIDSGTDEAIEAKKELESLRQMKPRKWRTALLLSILLGWCGGDRFYLGDIRKGLLKLITVGGFYVWWIIDIIRVAFNIARDVNGMKLEK